MTPADFKAIAARHDLRYIPRNRAVCMSLGSVVGGTTRGATGHFDARGFCVFR
jgi:hypothetical protein